MPEEIINITIEDSNEAVNITVDETTEQVNITISDGQVTNTSELINDGEDGVHPFITLEDIPASGVESVTGDLVDNTDPANPIINLPSLDFVPYTGATQDVDLGENSITANEGFIATFADGSFNATPTSLFYTKTQIVDNTERATSLSIEAENGVSVNYQNNDTPLFSSLVVKNDIQLFVNDNNVQNTLTVESTQSFSTKKVGTGEGFEGKYVQFDTAANETSAIGKLKYNDTDGTLDLGLKGGNVTLQIGQESVIRVVNKTATNITLLEANYQAVRVTGAQGQRMKVDLAQATTDPLSAETIGLVTETIANNQEGFVTTSGLIRNINTTGSLQGETWADGDILYLSPTVAGRVTKIKPTAPNHLVIIGYVIHAHITQGTIFVKIDNGYELDELHNVIITSAANNQGLIYESSSDLWKNKTIDKTLIGLANVDNTSDVNKPVSTAQTTAIDAKVADTITNGITTIAPSQNAVFDALVLRQRKLFNLSPQVTLTGTTVKTIIATYFIPANTFTAGDFLNFSALVSKVANISNTTHTLEINTTNTLAGATIITTVGFNTSNFSMKFKREMVLNGGNLFLLNLSAATVNDQTINSVAVLISTFTYNLAADLYFFVACQLVNATDSITYRGIKITD